MPIIGIFNLLSWDLTGYNMLKNAIIIIVVLLGAYFGIQEYRKLQATRRKIEEDRIIEESQQRKRMHTAQNKRAEAERIKQEQERAKAERIKREQKEAERIRKEQEQAKRSKREQEEAERIRREQEQAERIKREQKEAERIRREQEQAERSKREQEEAERIRKEQEQAERSKQKPKESMTFQPKANSSSLRTSPQPVKSTYITEDGEQYYSVYKSEASMEPEARPAVYTNYNPVTFNDHTLYPRVISPKYGTRVFHYRYGRSLLRGKVEESFQADLTRALHDSDFEVLGDVVLYPAVNTRPYEPDIAVIERNGSIRIDIEIDEPYSGANRNPIHLVGSDFCRDLHLTQLGWVVLRFSEYQVHVHRKQCIDFIRSVIDALRLDNTFTCTVPEESAWTRLQAQKWEQENYREKYLGINSFGRINLIPTPLITVHTPEEQDDLKEVEQTIAEVDSPQGYNAENSSQRDKELLFDAESHSYTFKGVPLMSVSTLVSSFFPTFDSDYWAERKAREAGISPDKMLELWDEKGAMAREAGSFMHEQIEQTFLGHRTESNYHFRYTGEYVQTDESISIERELALFNALNEGKLSKMGSIYRTEWRIYDETLGIAGTIDCLIKTPSGKYIMVDWKRSEKIGSEFGDSFIPKTTNKWGTGIGIVSQFDDTSYNHYLLQQNIYKYILKKRYGIEISEMYLAVIHPSYNNAYLLSVPNHQDIAEQMCRARE